MTARLSTEPNLLGRAALDMIEWQEAEYPARHAADEAALHKEMIANGEIPPDPKPLIPASFQHGQKWQMILWAAAVLEGRIDHSK